MIVDGRIMRPPLTGCCIGGSSIGRVALCLTVTVLLFLSSSSTSSNIPTSVMASDTSVTKLDTASNDHGMLSSYSAYRTYMNGKTGGDRHRKKSKGKEKKKKTTTTGTAATINEHDVVLPQPNRDNKLLSTTPSFTTQQQQQELNLAIAQHRQMQESSAATTTTSSSLCSCSPTIFTLTFNPTTLDCTTDTLKDNAGIKGTLCLLSDPTSGDESLILPDGIVGGGEEKMPTVTPTYMNDDEITTTTSSSPTCAGSECLIPVPVPVPVDDGSSSTNMPSSSLGSTLSPVVSDGGSSSAIPTVMSMDSSGSSSDGPTSSTYAPTYGPTSSTFAPTYVNDGDTTSPGDALIDAATATNTAAAGDSGGDDEMSKKELHQLKKDEAKEEKLMRTNSASLSSSTITDEQTSFVPTVYVTPYPTDDKTYEPTVLPTYLVDDDDVQQRRRLFVDDGATSSESPTTISHAQNLHDHTTFDLASVKSSLMKGIITNDDDDGRIGRRLLHDKSTFGIWKSIPLNDEFFITFPEFKSRQEDIYHMRRLNTAANSSSSSNSIVGQHERNLNNRGINNRQSEAGDELTLADIAAGNDDFSILLEAITAADLLDVLSGTDPLTVFAPTNEAFEALPAGMLDMLLLPQNIAILQDVLKYHCISGTIGSTDLVSGPVTTLQGTDVTVMVSDAGVKINYANVLYPDIKASNGIIHVIDAVLLPPVETDGVTGSPATSEVGSSAPTVSMSIGPTNLVGTGMTIAPTGASSVGSSITVGTEKTFAPTPSVVGSTSPPNNDGITSPPPNNSDIRIVSVQFLEMDTSPDMNIINQDDTYLVIDSDVSSLSYTSVSASLDPSTSLNDQLDKVPGGVILILIGATSSGEIVRNRVMWTYTMGCGTEEVTVEPGDSLGWTIFDKIEPALPEFCPAVSSGTIPSTMPSPIDMNKPSSKAGKPHKPPSSDTDFSMPHDEILSNFDLDPDKDDDKPYDSCGNHEDGKCNTDSDCCGNECCSGWGYCGKGEDYCGDTEINMGNDSETMCGIDDKGTCKTDSDCCGGSECCSEFGFCGKGEDYCGATEINMDDSFEYDKAKKKSDRKKQRQEHRRQMYDSDAMADNFGRRVLRPNEVSRRGSGKPMNTRLRRRSV